MPGYTKAPSTRSGRATRRRLPIEVRRTQVLDAALRLLSDNGYFGLSVEGIAREAGVSKTVVYDAFGGLEPLLVALLERQERGALRSLADAAPAAAEEDPVEAMAAWVQSLAAAILRDPVTWRLMLVSPQGTPAMVREHVQRGRDVALDQARLLAKAIVAARPALSAIDDELAARSLLAVAEEGAKLLLDEPERFSPDDLAGYARALAAAFAG